MLNTLDGQPDWACGVAETLGLTTTGTTPTYLPTRGGRPRVLEAGEGAELAGLQRPAAGLLGPESLNAAVCAERQVLFIYNPLAGCGLWGLRLDCQTELRQRWHSDSLPPEVD